MERPAFVPPSLGRRRLARALVCVAVGVLGVMAPGVALAQGSSCSVPLQNLGVRARMTDWYLWYDRLPSVSPLNFDSPEAYLDAIRYRPLDTSFSYIESRAVYNAAVSDSQFVGFGFSSTRETDEALRVTDVFTGSPADEAGLTRGDHIIEIDGRRVRDLVSSGEIGSAFGPSDAGVEREIVFTRGGVPRRARMVKRTVTIPTVSRTQVFQVGSRTVGYVFFKNFVAPSRAALDTAFADLGARGVNELVLDLRYNGGGLVSVAQHLASLIGGVRTEGQLLATYAFNPKHLDENLDLRFEPKVNALSLDRLVVITTRQSASASELIINALRPYIPVVVIGDRTYGKPVGQIPFELCDKVLALVAFSLRNANDEGDYFEGLPPTCPAADDLDHALGDPAESSLSEAVAYITTGRCSTVTPMRARPMRAPLPRVGGLRALIGAD